MRITGVGASFERIGLPTKLIAWCLLAISLAVTLWAYSTMVSRVERGAQVRFDFRVDEIQRALEERMRAYEQVLKGGVALFHASGGVTRETWRRYVDGLEIERNYPGIQGVGFAKRILPQELEEHVEAVREEGFPDYKVKPEGVREEYASIIYLEPFSGRNLRAFGFDMFSEPVRRAAMAAARDTAAPALSGKVTLVQETETDVQAGFLMYLPVYREATEPSTLVERRQGLLGYVYSPFRMNDLVQGVLRGRLSDVELEIYDGTRVAPGAELYSSWAQRTKEYENLPSYERYAQLTVNGQPWLLRVTSRPAFETSIDYAKPRIVLGGGVLISLLFFGVTWSLATTRERALALAARMSTALRENEEEYRASIDSVKDYGIVLYDREGRVKDWNEGAKRITGYTEEEVAGRHFSPSCLPVGEPGENTEDEFEAAVAQGRYETTGWYQHKDGTAFCASTLLTPLFTADGQVRGFIRICRDITEKIRAEEALREAHDELEKRVEARTIELKRSNEQLRDALALNESIISTSLLGIVAYRKNGECVLANRAAAALVGTTPDELKRLNLREILSGREPDLVARAQEALATGAPRRTEVHTFSVFGQEIWLDCLLVPFSNHGEQQTLVTLIDIRAQKRAEQALRESEAKFRGVLETAADGVLMVNEAGQIILANPMAEQMFGYGAGDLIGTSVEALVPESILSHHAAHRERYRSGSEPRATGTVVNVVARRKDGTEFPADISISPFRSEKGLLITAVVRDVSERRQAEAALRLRERAIESSSNGIMITDAVDPEHPITYVNRAFERITGYAAEEALGCNGRFLLGDDFEQLELEVIRAALREHREGSAILRCRHKEGRQFWNELNVAPVYDEAGRVTHFISVMTDATERKQYETQLEHQATHDALTGLANRVLLRDRLEQGMAQVSRLGELLAVIVVDLDRFMLINETLGHTRGDELIRVMAQRLQECVREGDTVARTGADDFVLILQGVAHIEEVTQAAHQVLQHLALPVTLAGRELFVTASLGLSVSGRDGDNPEALLKSAGAAMHRAKHRGGNTFAFFSQEMNSRAQDHLDMEADLRRALKRDELLLHYQPKVDLRTGSITGMEALVRWRHPEKGMISPNRFIPIAEETGLIVPIGEWVLAAACEQNATWQRQGIPVQPIAVNLSARQFREVGLLAVVQDVLQRSGLDPRLLEFEITESMLVQNEREAIQVLQDLKALGIELALDDFGTGYSSLGYLKRLPIDKLKIDRSFVRDVTSDPDDAIIATSVIALAHEMQLRVVAEGVETEAQLSYLRNHGCDEIQGYYFSRPVPAHEMEQLLVEGRRLAPQASPKQEPVLLLLDDEPSILTALRRLFRRDGYRILATSDPYEAFDLLAQNNVQVVISDQRMPKMSGTEFLNRVKDIYPNTVRIVLSGYTDLQVVTDAVNRGEIYRFLTKPWDDDELRAHVREAFEGFSRKRRAA